MCLLLLWVKTIMQRKRGERNFRGSWPCEYVSVCLSPLRKLEEVITKLEPLSDQHALIRFFHNIDNTKTLTGFVQELANAVTDYQVRAAGPTAIFNEHQIRFRYNKECTRGRETSMMIPRASVMIPKTSSAILRTSSMIPRTFWWGSSLSKYDLR